MAFLQQLERIGFVENMPEINRFVHEGSMLSQQRDLDIHSARACRGAGLIQIELAPDHICGKADGRLLNELAEKQAIYHSRQIGNLTGIYGSFSVFYGFFFG